QPCGENLYMSTAPSSWSDSIQAWYDEEKDFKYGSGATRANAVIGHYTQPILASFVMFSPTVLKWQRHMDVNIALSSKTALPPADAKVK
ncbi:hypothetical protein CIB84_013291, partial [Bambusicola thoracicus]